MTMLASRGQLRASFIRWALFTVPLIVLLGVLAGQAGGPDSLWFQTLDKPAIYPPPATFGIVWSILYVMVGLSLALICAAREQRKSCCLARMCATWISIRRKPAPPR